MRAKPGFIFYCVPLEAYKKAHRYFEALKVRYPNVCIAEEILRHETNGVFIYLTVIGFNPGEPLPNGIDKLPGEVRETDLGVASKSSGPHCPADLSK